MTLRLGTLLMTLLSVCLPAQSCGPRFAAGFGSQGAHNRVNAMVRWNPGGTGERVVVGGDFIGVGNVAANHIAEWDGTQWWPLGGGAGGTVFELAAFDDGTGEKIYAAGSFNLAVWDGTSWSGLSAGALSVSAVYDMGVFDLGAGPALYVCGDFSVGGTWQTRVARYDGTGFTFLGNLSDISYGIAAFDDGNGLALYVGGRGGTPFGASTATNVLRRWNGTAWSSVGTWSHNLGLVNVASLHVHDDGSGQQLYVGGDFDAVDGVNAPGLVRWNGSAWSAVGTGISGGLAGPTAGPMVTWDDGGGPALFVGGDFAIAGAAFVNGVAKWDGSQWSSLAGGLAAVNAPLIYAMIAYDEGNGEVLLAGGTFQAAGTAGAHNIARWNGVQWSTMPGGEGLPFETWTLEPYDDGGGEDLYIGGSFQSAGTAPAQRIARWQNNAWSFVGTGMDATVRTLKTWDDGTGNRLYAGGDFAIAGIAASRIAAWDGTQWSPLGLGLSGISPYANAQSMTVWDDGAGEKLWVSGAFSTAGALPAANLAAWDGSSWSSPSATPAGNVRDLCVYDDGTGPALFACGPFETVGGLPAAGIAKYDGVSWSALQGGLTGGFNTWQPDVTAMRVWDDGTGPALYVAGQFAQANGQTVNRIARWDGTSWSSLGGGITTSVDPARSPVGLEVFDDGRGEALFVIGNFTMVDGLSVNNAARWNGTSWSTLDGGLRSNLSAIPRDLQAFDDGSGPALWMAGRFGQAGAVASNHVAKWVPATPSLLVTQSGPGAPVVLSNAGLTAGHTYLNVLSFEPCPTGPGGGPWLGLCAANPAATLFWQLGLPPGTIPFHIVSTGPTALLGSYLAPAGLVLDALSIELINGAIRCVSPVTRFTVR